jgi:hypothetical protein
MGRKMPYALILMGLASAAGLAYVSLNSVQKKGRQKMLHLLTHEEQITLSVYEAIAKAISDVNGKSASQIALVLARACDPSAANIINKLAHTTRKTPIRTDFGEHDLEKLLLRARVKYRSGSSYKIIQELELYISPPGKESVSKTIISYQKDASDVFEYVREELMKSSADDSHVTIQIYPRIRAEETANG